MEVSQAFLLSSIDTKITAAFSASRVEMGGFRVFIRHLQMSGDGDDQNVPVPVTIRLHRICLIGTRAVALMGLRTQLWSH